MNLSMAKHGSAPAARRLKGACRASASSGRRSRGAALPEAVGYDANSADLPENAGDGAYSPAISFTTTFLEQVPNATIFELFSFVYSLLIRLALVRWTGAWCGGTHDGNLLFTI